MSEREISLSHIFQSVCRTPGPLCQFVLIKNPLHAAHETQHVRTDTHTHIHNTAVILGGTDDGLVGGKSTSVLFLLKE